MSGGVIAQDDDVHDPFSTIHALISKITDAVRIMSRHDDGMKATMSCAGHNTTFSLWHIPTSTLLVSTNVATEVERRIDLATSSGIVMDELMLNVEQAGSLIGKQHLGSYMLTVLHTCK
jgi:hypothetical protein